MFALNAVPCKIKISFVVSQKLDKLQSLVCIFGCTVERKTVRHCRVCNFLCAYRKIADFDFPFGMLCAELFSHRRGGFEIFYICCAFSVFKHIVCGFVRNYIRRDYAFFNKLSRFADLIFIIIFKLSLGEFTGRNVVVNFCALGSFKAIRTVFVGAPERPHRNNVYERDNVLIVLCNVFKIFFVIFNRLDFVHTVFFSQIASDKRNICTVFRRGIGNHIHFAVNLCLVFNSFG